MELNTVTNMVMSSIKDYGTRRVDRNSCQRTSNGYQFNVDRGRFTVEICRNYFIVRNNNVDRHVRVENKKCEPYELAELIIESLDDIKTRGTDKLKNEAFLITHKEKKAESVSVGNKGKQQGEENKTVEKPTQASEKAGEQKRERGHGQKTSQEQTKTKTDKPVKTQTTAKSKISIDKRAGSRNNTDKSKMDSTVQRENGATQIRSGKIENRKRRDT